MPTTLKHYDELVREFPLRPIRSERQLDRASTIASRLAAKSRLTAGEQDYLEVLSDLIERYEDREHAIDVQAGPGMLTYLIDENGSSVAQVAAATGMKPAQLQQVLDGSRELTLPQLRALSGFFRVSPALFVSGS